MGMQSKDSIQHVILYVHHGVSACIPDVLCSVNCKIALRSNSAGTDDDDSPGVLFKHMFCYIPYVPVRITRKKNTPLGSTLYIRVCSSRVHTLLMCQVCVTLLLYLPLCLLFGFKF
jgi:hypothetical protein